MTNSILSKYVAMLVMCFCLFGFSYSQVNLSNGLVLHLPLDGNFNDVSGYGHIVTAKNVSFKGDCSGMLDQGAYFNGVNSLLEIRSSMALNSTQKLTISFWINAENSNGNETIISRANDYSPGRALGYSVTLNNNRQTVFNTITPPGCATYDNSVADSLDLRWGWHSIIAIFDGIQMSIYTDGVLQNTINLPFNSLQFCQADMNLFIGASYSNQTETFKGLLDDIRIYNRAISLEEINSLASCSFSTSCPPPTELSVTKLSESIVDIYWKNNGSSYGTEVQYRPTTSSEFISSVASTTGDHGLLAGLAPGLYVVRIRNHCNYGNSRWVTVAYNLPAGPLCQPPNNLNIKNITENETTLSWDVKPDSVGVNLQYKEKGSGNWVDAGSKIIDKSLKITGLSPGTEYEWRVQAACPTGPSAWVSSEFKTSGIAPCRPPWDLIDSVISGNSVLLGWTAYSQLGSYQYETEYKESGTSNWIRILGIDHTSEFARIDTLKPLTTYDWRVRVVCDSRGASEWAVSIFTTKNGAPIDPSITLVSDFKFEPVQCSPAQLAFINQSQVAHTTVSTVNWNFGDGSSSILSDPQHRYSGTGTYNVTLTITDVDGRTNTKLRQVVIPELTLTFANAGNDMLVCSKDPVQLKASGGEKYEWLPCIGLNSCSSAEAILTPGLHENYIVKVTDKNGCTDTASISVKYIDPGKNIFIPNAFTPNNDGLNDLFKPLANIPGNPELRIFDRFGNVIFTSKDYQAAWDGTNKGKPLPPGSYPYMIRTKGEGPCANQVIKGTVMLIR